MPRHRSAFPSSSATRRGTSSRRADAITHFAFGCGDDNPLFYDPTYGPATRWHGQIASPTFPITTGLDQTPKFTDPERKKLFRGLFRGTGKYYSGVKWTWYRPSTRDVRCPGNYTLDVQVKESEFSGGRSVKETFRYLYVDADGNPIATRDESYINAERQGSKKSGKLKDVARKHWTPEEFAGIEAEYEAEERRGANHSGGRTSRSAMNCANHQGPVDRCRHHLHAHGLGLGRIRRSDR